MKIEACVKCNADVEVDDDYEPEGCCNGFECGCMGKQTNPVICDKCWDDLHSKAYDSFR